VRWSPSQVASSIQWVTDEGRAAKAKNVIVLFRPLLAEENAELRLHGTVLYNSIYRADDQLLVNTQIFGTRTDRATARRSCVLQPGAGPTGTGSPSGLVVMSQKVSTSASGIGAGSNSSCRRCASPVLFAVRLPWGPLAR